MNSGGERIAAATAVAVAATVTATPDVAATPDDAATPAATAAVVAGERGASLSLLGRGEKKNKIK